MTSSDDAGCHKAASKAAQQPHAQQQSDKAHLAIRQDVIWVALRHLEASIQQAGHDGHPHQVLSCAIADGPLHAFEVGERSVQPVLGRPICKQHNNIQFCSQAGGSQKVIRVT